MNSVELLCHIYLRYALFKILLVKRKGHFQMPDQFLEDILVRGRFLKDKIQRTFHRRHFLTDIPDMIHHIDTKEVSIETEVISEFLSAIAIYSTNLALLSGSISNH